MKIIRKTRLWSILTGIFSFLFCILMIGTYFGNQYSSAINDALNINPSKVIKDENSNEDTQYYKSRFDDQDKLSKWQKELCEQIQGEGSVLVKNNGALPVNKGIGVTTFGRSSVDTIYGGTGSGQVDTANAATLASALTNVAEFKVNTAIMDKYNAEIQKLKDAELDRKTPGFFIQYEEVGNATRLAEIPASVVEGWDVSYDGYKDLAVVTIGRSGGEGNDLPEGKFLDGEGYYEIQDEERELLKYVAGLGFGKIVVLINSSNAMALDWINDPEYKIDACLWIGGPGQYGLNGVAKILCGEFNPSGRFVDTYSSSTLSAPAMKNFGAYAYANADRTTGFVGGVEIDGNPGDSTTVRYSVYYMDEKEGIYVGYKYYETRYEDAVLGRGNANGNAGVYMSKDNKWNYTDEVNYAFGYGLSYTTFTQKLLKTEYDPDKDAYTLSVEVENTGKVAGKEVVQVYGQSEYTDFDRQNHIEKAAVQLVGFGKTKILKPNEKETVKVTVDRKELATYDAYVNKTYIFENGTYYLAIGSDAHDALNNILAAKGYTTSNGMDKNGDAEKTYRFDVATTDTTSYAYSDANKGVKVTNQFDKADLNNYGEKVTYLSRNDWQGTYPTTHTGMTATTQMINDLQFNYKADNTVAKVTTGAEKKYTVAMMRGLEYENPLWEDLLDQLTVEEMANMVANDGFKGYAADSVGLPESSHKDGPQGIKGSVGNSTKVSAIAYTAEVVMASTFNVEIMHDIGLSMGEDALRIDGKCVSGWYAPAVNIHRTPYVGRNYEYFSEDGFLSGKMAAPEIAGAESMGLVCFVKHFALNDFETYRQSCATFACEQAIREIYLKPFRYAVEEGGTSGIMSSYNRIGFRWAGAHKGLLTNVLREEWGFNGAVLTDAVMSKRYWMDVRIGLEAGNDMWLSYSDFFVPMMKDWVQNDNKLLANMRESCHHYLYAFANSSVMNGIGSTDKIIIITPAWQITVWVFDAVFGVLAVVGAVLFVVSTLQNKKEKSAK